MSTTPRPRFSPNNDRGGVGRAKTGLVPSGDAVLGYPQPLRALAGAAGSSPGPRAPQSSGSGAARTAAQLSSVRFGSARFGSPVPARPPGPRAGQGEPRPRPALPVPARGRRRPPLPAPRPPALAGPAAAPRAGSRRRAARAALPRLPRRHTPPPAAAAPPPRAPNRSPRWSRSPPPWWAPWSWPRSAGCPSARRPRRPRAASGRRLPTAAAWRGGAAAAGAAPRPAPAHGHARGGAGGAGISTRKARPALAAATGQRPAAGTAGSGGAAQGPPGTEQARVGVPPPSWCAPRVLHCPEATAVSPEGFSDKRVGAGVHGEERGWRLPQSSGVGRRGFCDTCSEQAPAVHWTWELLIPRGVQVLERTGMEEVILRQPASFGCF